MRNQIDKKFIKMLRLLKNNHENKPSSRIGLDLYSNSRIACIVNDMADFGLVHIRKSGRRNFTTVTEEGDRFLKTFEDILQW